MRSPEDIPDEADVMTIEEFKQACRNGSLTDDDGSGELVKDGKLLDGPNRTVYPSDVTGLSPGAFAPRPIIRNIRDFDWWRNATHIAWYNKS